MLVHVRIAQSESAARVPFNSSFTPPTRTRQNCLVLSPIVYTPLTRQICLVSAQFRWVLSCRQLCSHRRHRQDKTVLSWSCRRREQAIIILWRGAISSIIGRLVMFFSLGLVVNTPAYRSTPLALCCDLVPQYFPKFTHMTYTVFDRNKKYCESAFRVYAQ